MVENKEIMAKNIQKYMDLNNAKATDICKALNIKQNTFSDWVNAKTYPRIDAIEKLARYFGVSKAALVEDLSDYDYTLDEHNMIIEYRNSDKTTRDAIRRLLSYNKLINRKEDKK